MLNVEYVPDGNVDMYQGEMLNMYQMEVMIMYRWEMLNMYQYVQKIKMVCGNDESFKK